MKTGRNDPCPCGSGRKYKLCCLKKKDDMSPRQKQIVMLGGIVFVVIVIFGVITVVKTIRSPDEHPAVQRVWSEEHQHWHYTQ